MDHSVQGCFLPHNTCKYCGAGTHNNNQHDENCLINLSKHEEWRIKVWRKGYRNRMNDPIPRDAACSGMGEAEVEAYIAGWSCADKMQKLNVQAA